MATDRDQRFIDVVAVSLPVGVGAKVDRTRVAAGLDIRRSAPRIDRGRSGACEREDEGEFGEGNE